jgi:hypothetical protein
VGARRNRRNFGDKAIALSRHGAQESRVIRILLQGGADFADGSVDAVIGVHKNILAPNALKDLVPGDELSPLFRKKEKQFQGDSFEADNAARAAQLKSAEVELKVPEVNDFAGHGEAVWKMTAILPGMDEAA